MPSSWRAITENWPVTERLARRAHKEIGTALYRAYLQRLIPEVRAMRAEIDADAEGFPDLLARSSVVLRAVLEEALGELPAWARPLGFDDYFGIRHRRFRDQLEAMMADAEDRVAVNRRAGELTVSFGGDTNQAGQFADVVRLDLHALEQEMGFAVGHRSGWWHRVMRRQGRADDNVCGRSLVVRRPSCLATVASAGDARASGTRSLAGTGRSLVLKRTAMRYTKRSRPWQ